MCVCVCGGVVQFAIFSDDLFSLPEHEALMLNYCDQSLSVVRALSTLLL